MKVIRDLSRQISNLRAHQASAWLSAVSKPQFEGRDAFFLWLQESPLNVGEFLAAWSIDEALGGMDPAHHHDVESLLKQINPRVGQLSSADSSHLQKSHPITSGHRWRYAIAASVAAVGLILGTVLFWRQTGWEQFRTGPGEQSSLRLDDGTIVRLNANSHIDLKYSPRYRTARLLDGDALFEVNHDPRRPFRVYTRDAVITDIGTRFNVSDRAGGISVAVIEGSVEITATAAAYPPATTSKSANGVATLIKQPADRILTADQEAQIDHNGFITVAALADASQLNAWQQKRLVYRKESLAHIVDDFNRYNQRRILLEGDNVRQRPYTGVFDASDPDSLAQVLAHDPELVVEQSADTIVVRAR